jgi:hypothetical protein
MINTVFRLVIISVRIGRCIEQRCHHLHMLMYDASTGDLHATRLRASPTCPGYDTTVGWRGIYLLFPAKMPNLLEAIGDV